MFVRSKMNIPVTYRKGGHAVIIKPMTVTLVDSLKITAKDLKDCYGERIEILTEDSTLVKEDEVVKTEENKVEEEVKDEVVKTEENKVEAEVKAEEKVENKTEEVEGNKTEAKTEEKVEVKEKSSTKGRGKKNK